MAEAPRQWWQPPRLQDATERSVGWLELFFDLVFVVVVSRLAHHLGTHISGRGVLEFVLQFIAVFWIWNAFTYYTERFESGGLDDRAFTFLALLGVAALAVFSDGGLDAHYPAFVATYLACRAINMVGWARAARHVPVFRPVAYRFMAGCAVAALLLVISLPLGRDARLVLWAVAITIDVLTPAFTVKQQIVLPPISASRFPERFGLFTLIVLGESIIGVVNGVSEISDAGLLTTGTLVDAALGLAIGFGLWWVYFDFIARRPPKPLFTANLLWVYLHILAAMAVTVTGAGISAVIAESAHDASSRGSQVLLAAGVAGALLAFAALEVTLARADDEPTDAVLSPALKVASGAVVLAVGIVPVTWDPTALLAVGALGLAVPAGYGAWVWFTRGPGSVKAAAPADPPAAT